MGMMSEENAIIITALIVALVAMLMPFVKRNRYFGLRCSWTYYSEKTWRRANTASAFVLMSASAFTIAFSMAYPRWAVFALAGSLVVATAISLALAYAIYKYELRR